MEKAKKPYKNRFFFKVGIIQKCEKIKKRIFSKNCLTLFVSGKEKTRIFVHTICFGKKVFFDQNSVNQEKL